jgi:CubicO group peptidase (beta-lactamase class C family)
MGDQEMIVVFVKRLAVLLMLMTLWTCIAAYGAISGWWLQPVAPKGDTEAFWNAALSMSATQSPGNMAMVLMSNGEVYRERFEPSRDRIDRETLFALASLSKWVSAYSVMQLVQAGKVELDAPVSRYLKRWQLPKSEFDLDGVTVRRLLSHTAGLTDGLGFGDYGADEVIPTLEDSLRQPRTSSGTATIAVGRAPGSTWQYSGGGYLILQLMVEEVSGMSFAAWTQQAVFDPIGMHRASYAYIGALDNASKSYDGNGKLAPSYKYASAAATGLSASTSDLVRFAQAHMHAARVPALNQTNIDAMRQPHGSKFGADIWGLGVMLYAPTARADHIYGHDGSNDPAINTALRINPDNGDAIIVLVTGNPRLASAIAYEWTLWQTGTPDFLMLDKAFASAFMPLLLGLLGIVAMFVLWLMRQRRRLHARSQKRS